MPEYPAASEVAPSVVTLDAPRVRETPRAVSYLISAVLIAVVVSGLMLLVLTPR